MSLLRSSTRPGAMFVAACSSACSFASSSRCAAAAAAAAALPSRSQRTYSTPGAPSPPAALPLSWPTYLALRHTRRLYERATTIPATLASLVVSAGYFGNLEADPTQTIMGVEPIFAYIGAT